MLKRSDNLKIIKVEGIVVSATNYSESSKILNVYTKDFGMVGIISKGCRNLKSSLRIVSDKLTYGDFNIYYKEGGLSTLISIDTKNNFFSIKKDIVKISYATYLLDLVNQIYKENKNKEMYDVLISSLVKIEDGFNPTVITNIVELKFLEYLGVMPVIDRCVICDSDKNIVTIDGDKGGYVCRDCYENEKIVDLKTIKLLRMFYYVDIAKISELNIKDINIKEINDFLTTYYDRYTGLYLKSRDMLNYLNKYQK